MELINQAVIHKTFGEGKIISIGNGYITILFAQGEKKFMYPSAFKQFLSMKDSVCTTFIQAEISTLDAKEAEAAEQKRLLAIQQQESALTAVTTKDSKPAKKVKVFPRANIAFKCNFCDGGKSAEQVGFNGVCSDAVIYNNVEVPLRLPDKRATVTAMAA